jgi:hypothetical protein
MPTGENLSWRLEAKSWNHAVTLTAFVGDAATAADGAWLSASEFNKTFD